MATLTQASDAGIGTLRGAGAEREELAEDSAAEGADGVERVERVERTKLYAHEPETLLRLLRAHLPYSLTVYSTIQGNEWRGLDIPGGTCLPLAGRDDGDGGDGGDGEDGRGAHGGVSEEVMFGAAWATFPPEELGEVEAEAEAMDRGREPGGGDAKDGREPGPGPLVWAVIIFLPRPQINQTRAYCSLDRVILPPLTDLTDPTDPTSTTAATGVASGNKDGVEDVEVDRQATWRKRGQTLMSGMVRTVIDSFPRGVKYVPLNVIWIDEVVREIEESAKGGDRRGDGVSVVREVYEVWCAPEEGIAGEEGNLGDGDGERLRGADMTGLEIGECRIEDCEIIQRTRDIPEVLEYYHARLAHTSVIRRTDTKEPVCWIMTHSAGDLGALFTVPAYRRRGLARAVVAHRLGAQRGLSAHPGDVREGWPGMQGAGRMERDTALRGHVWVSAENVGSTALWRSLGWKRGWSARWVCVQ